MIVSSDEGANSKAVTALCHICSAPHGIEMVMSRNTVVNAWLRFAASRNDALRISFFVSLKVLLQNAPIEAEERVFGFFSQLPNPRGKNTLFMEIFASPFKALEEPLLQV
jgi:hypothetical protein